MPPERRALIPQSVKVTGRTLRFKGNIDLEAAKKYFYLDPDKRLNIKFVNMTDVWRIHAIGLMPIVADMLAHGRQVQIRCIENYWVNRYLSHYGYGSFLTTGKPEEKPQGFVYGVNQYSVDDVRAHVYVRQLLRDIMQRRSCGRDILEALEWATAELIGNVFDHSSSSVGVLTQYVSQEKDGSRRFIFTLVDTGIGVLNSLLPAYPQLHADAEAIELAIQKGTTSKRDNYGWGLFGSTAIVRAAGGRFMLWSGKSALHINESGRKSYVDMPFFHGTAVEWILPLDTDIDLGAALQRSGAAGMWSLELEKYEPVMAADLKAALDRLAHLRAAGVLPVPGPWRQ